MRWLRKIWAVFRKRRLDDDLREELAAHIAMLTEDNIAAGLSPDEARRRARIAVGNLGVAHELHRDARGLPTLESIVQDIRYGLRALRSDYGFTLIAVLILGVGIGANAVVSSFVDTLLLRPLPFVEADRLVWVSNGRPGETNPSGLASRVLTLRGWREGSSLVSDFAAYSPFFTRASWALTGDGEEPELLKGVRVTDNLLPLLGVNLHLGRSFVTEEVVPDGPAAVIISHRLWQRRFASDPEIIGKRIELNDSPWTVVGVTPADFDFGSVFEPGYTVDLLLPAVLDEMDSWGNTLSVVGRLAPGASLQAARQEMAAVTEQLKEDRPELEGWTVYARVSSLQDHVSAPIRGALWLLWGAVGMVLLIVCANLSNLMLVRGVSRRRELAVRAALGAGRRRLVRQLLTESFTLSLLGVAAGLALAFVAVRTIVRTRIVVMPMIEHVDLSAVALVATAVVAVLVTAVVGLVPALHLARRDPLADLGQSSRGAVGDRRQSLTRSTLVVAEIALACSLLIGAGLLIRSFRGILDVDLGFDPVNRASFQVNAGPRYESAADVIEFQRLVVQTLRDIPGVENAALSDNLPLDGNRSWGLRRAGEDSNEEDGITAFVRLVSDDYFETMGVPILEGRGFSPDDTTETEPAIVLNETAARTLWPGGDALGRLANVYLGDVRVIGIVRDVHHNRIDEESGAEMYLPLSQDGDTRSVSAIVHTTRSPTAMAGVIRAAVQRLDPRVPVTDFRRMSWLVDRAVSPRRFLTAMLAGFAAIAVVLAALGIYGVISYSVRQRRAEIGVRLALGAAPARVLVDEIRRGVAMAAIGVGLGLIGAVLLSSLMASQLYRVGATDPVTYAGMTAILLGVALAAGFFPARRASKTDPVRALRDG